MSVSPQPVTSLNFLQNYDFQPTVLTGAGSFTSEVIDLGSPLGYARWRLFVYSDQAGTASLQQSSDGSTFYTTLSQAYSAGGQAAIYESLVTQRYLQAVYVNGSSAQSQFRLLATLVAV